MHIDEIKPQKYLDKREQRHILEKRRLVAGLALSTVAISFAVVKYLPNNFNNEAIETPQSINNYTETQKTEP